jgi:hypothetical protein
LIIIDDVINGKGTKDGRNRYEQRRGSNHFFLKRCAAGTEVPNQGYYLFLEDAHMIYKPFAGGTVDGTAVCAFLSESFTQTRC